MEDGYVRRLKLFGKELLPKVPVFATDRLRLLKVSDNLKERITNTFRLLC